MSDRSAFFRYVAAAGRLNRLFNRSAPGRALGRLLGRCVKVIVCAYARFELPRGVGLIEASIQAFPSAWEHRGVRECRGLWHGYRLRLDLADYFQRLAFYLRRHHDAPLQFLIARFAGAGDTVIDAGANTGMVAMYAAWRVGPGGLVHAFEPSPPMLEQIRWHVTTNRLDQVHIHACGVSDRDADLELRLPDGDNSGAATFATPPERYGSEQSARWPARVIRLDEVNLEVRGRLIIKLDVEGFELKALQGMAALIESHRPIVISEVNEEMLAQAGACGQELISFMTARGYRAYAFTTGRAWVRQRRLELVEVGLSPTSLPPDVVFIHTDHFQPMIFRR